MQTIRQRHPGLFPAKSDEGEVGKLVVRPARERFRIGLDQKRFVGEDAPRWRPRKGHLRDQ